MATGKLFARVIGLLYTGDWYGINNLVESRWIPHFLCTVLAKEAEVLQGRSGVAWDKIVAMWGILEGFSRAWKVA